MDTKNHREHRHQLKQSQAGRWSSESKTRSARLQTGLKALWFRVTGKYRQIKKENEDEANVCKTRDQSEMQKLIDAQLKERKSLQYEIRMLRHHHTLKIKRLYRDIGAYLKLSSAQQNETPDKPMTRCKTRRLRKSMSSKFD